MRQETHVACIGVMKNSYKIVGGKSKGSNHFRDLGVDGSIILQCIFQKYSARA
jgi:hypothetical protein